MLKHLTIKLIVGLALVFTLLGGITLAHPATTAAPAAHPHLLACAQFPAPCI